MKGTKQMQTERIVTDYTIPGKAPVVVTKLALGGYSVVIAPWYEAGKETAEEADDLARDLARIERIAIHYTEEAEAW